MGGNKIAACATTRLLLATSALVSASCLGLGPRVLSCDEAQAEELPIRVAEARASELPALTVDQPTPRVQRRRAEMRRRETTEVRKVVQRRAPRLARPAVLQTTPTVPIAAPAGPASPADTQDSRTGTAGVYSNSTAVATKTNTPLVNIPQSVSVLTKSFIQDQSPQNLTDVTRYVPGVAIHQGEGNRDELVIRGVDSSANFFVNGFRDDVQIFRDLYNTQSLEILKGPSALTFGRGSGGGLVNRTLKEADWSALKEVMLQTGSYYDRRTAIDIDQPINENVAARLNAVYEKSDTFRDFGHLERYGINPTVTFKLDASTKIRLSYEHFHDERTADRGNPSQALSFVAPSSTRFNPAAPFAPGADVTRFFGSPDLNVARANVDTVMAFLEHDFGGGLTAKNSFLFADYKKFYQNVYPGNGAISGAVNPLDTAFNRAAYNHETDRENFFNQTDFVFKGSTGPVFHTIAFGTEFGRQTGLDLRNTGIFPNGTNTIIGNPWDPTYFGPVAFVHQVPGAFSPGVSAADSNSKYRLNIGSVYARDTVEITPWLQVIGGARVDTFDIAALDQNTSTNRTRLDNVASPQGAVILKPWQNVSLYAMYSVSYLPASGDQFSALTSGTVILAPQKFENKEIGLKWNILPRLLFTAALYNLDRTNVPLPDPNNPGFFILSGRNRIRGFETELKGYVTDALQSSLGYAHTDARVASDTSTTIVKGNRIQLVPFSQFAWWNKYQFTPFWSAALGVIYFSSSYASSDDTVRLPGFVRFDGAAYAQITPTWKVQLNVENMLNKHYWASADGNNNISPGQGRTVRLTTFVRF
jgi:catecholate siderophore receptor